MNLSVVYSKCSVRASRSDGAGTLEPTTAERKARPLLGAILLASMISVAWAQDTGTVTCVVVDGKTNKPVANYPVTVKLFAGAAIEKSYEAKTDNNGVVVAKDAPWGNIRSVGFDVMWKGKLEKARKFGLTGPRELTLRLVVGRGQAAPAHGMPTRPPRPHARISKLSIRICQSSISVGEERLSISESVLLAVPADWANKPIHIALPKGVSRVEPTGRMKDAKIRMVDGGFELREGLPAGRRQVNYWYSLRYTGPDAVISREIIIPVELMRILFQYPAAKLVSEDFVAAGKTDHEHDHGLVYQAANLEPHRVATFRLEDLPHWPGPQHGMLATVAALLAAGAVGVYVLHQRRREARDRPQAIVLSLDESRARLIQQIAEADISLTAAPDDKKLRNKRSSLMGQLRQLTEQLQQAQAR